MSELRRLLGWFLGVGEKDEECLSPDFTEDPRIRETRSCFMGAFHLFGVFFKITDRKGDKKRVGKMKSRPEKR